MELLNPITFDKWSYCHCKVSEVHSVHVVKSHTDCFWSSNKLLRHYWNWYWFPGSWIFFRCSKIQDIMFSHWSINESSRSKFDGIHSYFCMKKIVYVQWINSAERIISSLSFLGHFLHICAYYFEWNMGLEYHSHLQLWREVKVTFHHSLLLVGAWTQFFIPGNNEFSIFIDAILENMF